MTGLRAVELAGQLGLSKGRISQLVGEGRLNGCFSGDGFHRRFDLDKVAAALNVQLHPGQMLGNGAGTKRAIKEVLRGEAVPAQPSLPQKPKGEALLPADPDRYELARSAKAEEELRAMRLRNGRDEGQYVLASEVERNVSQVMAQNLAEMEVFIRDSAQLVADRMGIDKRQVRQVIMDAWRQYRTGRAQAMAAGSELVDLSNAEKEAQI